MVNIKIQSLIYLNTKMATNRSAESGASCPLGRRGRWADVENGSRADQNCLAFEKVRIQLRLDCFGAYCATCGSSCGVAVRPCCRRRLCYPYPP